MAESSTWSPGAIHPESGLRPALVCFYSGGMEAEGGRKLLQRWLAAAAAFGFSDQLVCDHQTTNDEDAPSEGDGGGAALTRYVDRLASEVTAAFG